MKKVLAMVMVLAMVLAFGATAFAAGGGLPLEQAKQTALSYAGVNAAEATFTKAYKSFDDGREVYEIEFYVGNTEYDMDVDVYSGMVTDFNMEVHAVYSAPANNSGYTYYYDDDMYDYDLDDRFDRYDRDWDDIYDPYDRYDDMYDFDD